MSIWTLQSFYIYLSKFHNIVGVRGNDTTKRDKVKHEKQKIEDNSFETRPGDYKVPSLTNDKL